MNLSIFSEVDECLLKLDGIVVKDLNPAAMDYGFSKGQDILGVFSCDVIDELVEKILERESFKMSFRAYFFSLSTFRDVEFSYDSENSLATLKDLTEKMELINAKREFVTLITHELMNPISALKANIFALKEFELCETDVVENIERNIKRVERITKQLKLIAMAELGLYKPNIQPIDPEKIFKEVVIELEDKIKEKDVKVEFTSRVDVIETDGFVFFTIMKNLVSNAVKYSFRGGKVDVILKDDELRVKDRGIGIRDEEKSRIFERFFRGSTARMMAKGSGLGLSVVKHLCELMGYRVSFTSDWLVGSEFVVSFKPD